MIKVKRSNRPDWTFTNSKEGFTHKTNRGTVYRIGLNGANQLSVQKKVGTNWVPADQKTVRVAGFSLGG